MHSATNVIETVSLEQENYKDEGLDMKRELLLFTASKHQE